MGQYWATALDAEATVFINESTKYTTAFSNWLAGFGWA